MVLAVPVQLRSLEAIENAYVAAIKASPIGALLRQVETLPGDLTPAEVGDRLKAMPAAFVAFGGGSIPQGRQPTIDGNFTVFVITGQGVKEEQRRRGTAVVVGAYQIAQAVLMKLHGRPLPPPVIGDPPAAIDGLIVGSPYGTDMRPYWGEGVNELGLTIYGITFSQRITFPPIDDDELSDFVTFRGQIVPDTDTDGGETLPLPADEFLTDDVVTLPTE